MKATLIREMTCTPTRDFPTGRKPAGTEIDHPQAFRLVQMGVALPADPECEQASGRTEEELAEARYAYERTSKGIHPEDFAAYEAGQMDGYDPAGNPTLGGQRVKLAGQRITEE